MQLHQLSGASVRRVVDRSNARVGEHAHDWPVLSLFVLGSYRNETELGERFIAGPSAVLYQAGAAHRNTVAMYGFEQIEIEFDPAWLGRGLLPGTPVSRWVGGRAGFGARSLARLLNGTYSKENILAPVQRFVEQAAREPERTAPGWLSVVTRRLSEDTSLKMADLAREVGRHPSWLGTAYRRVAGERLLETAARLRVERAARLLRETDAAGAAIAQEAGFCDQSHMDRTFRRILGRSPSAVREDRAYIRRAGTTGP